MTAEGFDETLYVPKKPEFELYLDKQDNQTVGAKLVAAYGDDKYNVLQKIEPGEVRDLGEEMRVRTLVEPYFNEYGLGQTDLHSLAQRGHALSAHKQRSAAPQRVYVDLHDGGFPGNEGRLIAVGFGGRCAKERSSGIADPLG